jgi:hypothetical protein
MNREYIFELQSELSKMEEELYDRMGVVRPYEDRDMFLMEKIDGLRLELNVLYEEHPEMFGYGYK